MATLLTEKKLSPFQVRKMFEAAAAELDHFPSIAEMSDIVSKNAVRLSLSQPRIPEPEHTPNKGPWPDNFMALMLCMERGHREGHERGFAVGRASCDVSDDEAMHLFYCYQQKNFLDGRSREIINRPKKGTAAQRITRALASIFRPTPPAPRDPRIPE